MQLEGKGVLLAIKQVLDYTDLEQKIQQKANFSYLRYTSMSFQMAGQTHCWINESRIEWTV